MNAPPAPKVSDAPAFPLIWVVPLIALAIGGWMGFRELRNRGPEITIDFADSSGVEAGKTVLDYKGVSAGTVVHRDGDLGITAFQHGWGAEQLGRIGQLGEINGFAVAGAVAEAVSGRVIAFQERNARDVRHVGREGARIVGRHRDNDRAVVVRGVTAPAGDEPDDREDTTEHGAQHRARAGGGATGWNSHQ